MGTSAFASKMARWAMGMSLAGGLGIGAAKMADAAELPAWLTERRIVGTNDLESIEAVKTTNAYDFAKIVARVETADGEGFCTSSRVANNIFLTNFHCYEFAPCESVRFHLGYEKDLPTTQQALFRCKEVLSTSLKFDYALYRVEYIGPVGGAGARKHEFLNLGMSIPDNNPNGASHPFDIQQDGQVASIAVTIKATHPRVSDLKIVLKSPSGKAVTLLNRATGVAANLDRTFRMTDGLVAYEGLDADGVWELVVSDRRGQQVGTLNSVVFDITTRDGSEERGQAEEFPTATLWTGELSVDQPLVVASHPSARLKEIDRSAGCKLRTIVTEVVSERETLTHTCDTEGGSSGSPVLDRRTGQIVALHWGGTDGYNLAIPMSKIVANLKAELKPSVFAELNVAH